MSLTDEEFREEYKPLYVPAHYDAADTQQNKVIFALAQIGEGRADDVIHKLSQMENAAMDEQGRVFVQSTLKLLFEQGHLTGAEKDGEMHYNLNKITQPNDGRAEQQNS